MEFAKCFPRRKSHVRGGIQHGQQPTFARCAIAVRAGGWAWELVFTNRTDANSSTSQWFIATWSIWQAAQGNPNDASVFAVGGNPASPGTRKEADTSRAVVLRIAGGVLFTDWAKLAPAPLFLGPKRTPIPRS